MNSLESIAEELQKNLKTASMNLEEIPWNTRGAWGASIANAKAKLPELRKAYKKALLQGGVAIFLDGDPGKAAEFARLIRDVGEGLAVDASSLYERLARGVDATMSEARTWGVHQTAKLHRDLQEVMHEVGISELPMPSRGDTPVVPTLQDAIAHVRKILRDAVGDSLNNLYVADLVLRDATEIRYVGSVVPVAILNAATEDRVSLAKEFGRGHATVVVKADEDINENYMKKVFRDINKSIRKSSNE